MRKIRLTIHLFTVRHKEALDAAQEKSNAALAIIERKMPRRQTLATPALDRLAGDVESLRDVVDRQYRLIASACRKIQRLAQPLDEQTQVVLKRKAGKKIRVYMPGVIAGDAEDDEIERIGLRWIDLVQEPLGGWRRASAPRATRRNFAIV